MSCRSDTIPARAPLGHPTPYLQGHQSVQVPTNKCNQEESLSMVHLRWFDRDTSRMNWRELSSHRSGVPRHQRNELKKNILVSSQWNYTTEPATRVKYEPKHS